MRRCAAAAALKNFSIAVLFPMAQSFFMDKAKSTKKYAKFV